MSVVLRIIREPFQRLDQVPNNGCLQTSLAAGNSNLNSVSKVRLVTCAVFSKHFTSIDVLILFPICL
jgi:hypothetical protein